MEKVKEKSNNFFSKVKKLIGRFPLTIGIIFILTLIYIISIDLNLENKDLLPNISAFLFTFAFETFLIETILREKSKFKIWFYIIAGIVSGVFTAAGTIIENFDGMQRAVSLFWLKVFIICFRIVLINLGIYFNYKKSDKPFKEYITKTYISIFKTNLIYAIFAIGLLIVTSIFVFLILGGKGYTLVLKVELLLLGIYLVPRLIYNVSEPEAGMGKFSKVVIKYVLGSLIIASFAIIYMYIIKILVLRSMPSNQIFRILVALFIMGLPIWTMCEAFDDGKIFDKINNKLPLLFIPFIFLQIYAIGVRIVANGFTIPRYLCVMIVVFEIIYTIVYMKNKENVGRIFIVIPILVVVATIVPYINMFTVSAVSQCNNMRLYTRKDDLSYKEKMTIVSGYNYLNNSVLGPKYITQEDRDYIEKIREEQRASIGSSSNEISNNNLNVSSYMLNDAINIEGYTKLYEINKNQYVDPKDNKIMLEVAGLQIDITSKMYEYLEHKNNIYEYFDNENEILQDNIKIIITNLNIEYTETTVETITYFSIDGFLLEK